MPIQQIGLGMAAAIFVDAYLISTVLVPAVMHVLGRSRAMSRARERESRIEMRRECDRQSSRGGLP